MRPQKITASNLTVAARYIEKCLVERNLPIISPFEFNHLIWEMYQKTDGKKLGLSHQEPSTEDYSRLRSNLREARIISPDPDYGRALIRVLPVPDLYADDIVCLADSTVRVAYLSAMRRWGLTERIPYSLMLARPKRKSAIAQLKERMEETLDNGENNPAELNIINHPKTVRRRNISIHFSHYLTNYEGTIAQPWDNLTPEVRLSSIGQTFLDTLQQPDLCGGMNHVLDVWDEHAHTWLEEIVQSVNRANDNLVMSRAGYIIEERLGLTHPLLAKWKLQCHRGGTNKLDPNMNFVPTFSEKWMISINA